MTDPILDEVQRAREELLRRFGGIDGLFRHLQAMDRARLRRAKQRRGRKATLRTSKNSGSLRPSATKSKARTKANA